MLISWTKLDVSPVFHTQETEGQHVTFVLGTSGDTSCVSLSLKELLCLT